MVVGPFALLLGFLLLGVEGDLGREHPGPVGLELGGSGVTVVGPVGLLLGF